MAKHPWYMDWFDSPFYHKLYFERDEKEAETFIQRLITYLNPTPGTRMLDLACGKGRHSKILAAMGFDVTGIDISSASIGYAKQYESDNLHFAVHDMRLLLTSNYFEFVFNFFTSFGYFKTRREHDDAIRMIARSLQPNGRFIIDYLNVHCSEERLKHNEEKKINGTTYSIHRWDDDSHFYKKITVIDPGLIEPISYTERVAKFTLGDFTDMLGFQGLQVEEVFGDYQLNPYDIKKTPRLIIVARKSSTEIGDKEKRLYSDGRSTDSLT